jgi:hypothetical protein
MTVRNIISSSYVPDRNAQDYVRVLPTFLVYCHREYSAMAKLIIEPKKAKEGQIDYIVTYHDPKSDNQFMVTTTPNLDEAVQRLRETLENEVQAMQQKK